MFVCFFGGGATVLKYISPAVNFDILWDKEAFNLQKNAAKYFFTLI